MERRKLKRCFRILLLLIVLICLVQVGRERYLAVRYQRQQEQLRNAYRAGSSQENAAPRQEGISEKSLSGLVKGSLVEQEPPQPQMLDRFKELYEQNNELVGWLSIDGMEIDFPVMQGVDDEYYLKHDFYKNEDKHGVPYVRTRADVNAPGTNFIIYGHNMFDGSMFAPLEKYQKESFYREHPVISFDTLYEERTYEIVAVFLSKVYNEGDDVFKYYQFYQANTEGEFSYFYENIKELALYDTGVTAEFGDNFLTLSTCSYHTEDGRLAVVAKQVTP
ncbi:MAG: class B sortase [Bacteroidales bacterium]|nr:class B sortase [Lachnoclostridium sp.]MCM1385472.1 class B sortase [Lachnoclostridium sp.]MCM1466242.1 class B sortase [Bacteroidales bacterium]